MKTKPKMSRNNARKQAYKQMGRERGDPEHRNQEINRMTESGEKLLKAEVLAFKATKEKKNKKEIKQPLKEEELLQAVEDAKNSIKMPSATGSGKSRAGKRARLKVKRATGNMPKRKWDPETNKRIRTRTKVPGSHAEYLQKKIAA